MQRIRIGNDVRLNLTLRGPRTYDQANIKQLKCYLINTSMLDYFPVDCFWNKHVHGCGCVEMESFALFANAKATGKKAACLLTISDSFVTHVVTSSEERQNCFTNMMKVALELALYD